MAMPWGALTPYNVFFTLSLRATEMARFVFLLTVLIASRNVGAQDWPCFRGPDHNGHAKGKYPIQWAPGENIKWKLQLPGLGNSSPIVVGNQVYVVIAEEKGKKRSLRSYDRDTGKPGWFQVVEFGGDE